MKKMIQILSLVLVTTFLQPILPKAFAGGGGPSWCVGLQCGGAQSGQKPWAFPEWGEPFQVQPGSPLDKLTHWLFDPILEAPEHVYQHGIRIGDRVFLPGAMGEMTPGEELAADISGGFGAGMSKFAAEVGIGEGMGGIRGGIDAIRQAIRGIIPQPLPVGAGIPGARVPGVNPLRGPVAGDPLGDMHSMKMQEHTGRYGEYDDFGSRGGRFRERPTTSRPGQGAGSEQTWIRHLKGKYGLSEAEMRRIHQEAATQKSRGERLAPDEFEGLICVLFPVKC